MILYRSTYFQFSIRACVPKNVEYGWFWIIISMNSTNKHILSTLIIINKKILNGNNNRITILKARMKILNYINRDNFKNNIKEANQ
jgi:hypothetical protein